MYYPLTPIQIPLNDPNLQLNPLNEYVLLFANIYFIPNDTNEKGEPGADFALQVQSPPPSLCDPTHIENPPLLGTEVTFFPF
jgi:hypothetical protein